MSEDGKWTDADLSAMYNSGYYTGLFCGFGIAIAIFIFLIFAGLHYNV